jgi:hypothetical protein
MAEKTWGLTLVASGLVLAACSGAGGGGASSISVTREGRPGQSFGSAALACTISRPDPSSETSLIDCVHGDPETTGLHLVAYASGSLADLPEGTTLEQGVDFNVTSLEGMGEGVLWGAGGDSSWWTGDLMIVLEARTGDGQPATFDGTMQTTEVASSSGLTPITVVFDGVSATLP